MKRANINNILFIFTNVSQLYICLYTHICKHNLNLREGSRGQCFGVKNKEQLKIRHGGAIRIKKESKQLVTI